MAFKRVKKIDIAKGRRIATCHLPQTRNNPIKTANISLCVHVPEEMPLGGATIGGSSP